jgi:hypothetical protein
MEHETRVLQSLSLGGSVAEHESDLSSYFLRTPDFQALVRGQHDLILGAKGSGKSAMFRVLMDPDFEVPELAATVVIPAFADDDVILLRQLFEEGSSETDFRIGWKGFFAALAGNYLANNGGSSPDIERRLTDLGLRLETESQWEFWRRFMSRVRSGLSGISASGEVELPLVKAKIAIAHQERSGSDISLSIFDYEKQVGNLLRLVDRELQRRGLSCWLIVDRLDEVFAGRKAVEGAALRGLLRTQSDIHSASGSLRVKTFLRNDVLLRITRDGGFTNLTHLRALVLELSADDMAKIIGARLERSEDFMEYMEGTASTQTSRRAAVNLFLPERMEIGRDYRSGYVWLYRVSMDASGFINPRNILSIAEEAVLKQTRVIHSGREKGRAPAGHLLSGTVCADAYREVSKRRLVDTLFAEYPWLRASIERFRFNNASPGGFKPTLDDIAALQKLEGVELTNLVEELVECGFLRRVAPQRFEIGSIYQQALAVVS